MWDINTGECLHVLMGHVAAVRCVQYDGRLVVSGAYDYMVIDLFLKFFGLERPQNTLFYPKVQIWVNLGQYQD